MLIDLMKNIDVYQGNNGINFIYDKNRSKWLSIDRNIVEFSINHNRLKSKMWMIHNSIRSNLSGFLVNRNITITLISIITRNISNCKFKIFNEYDIIYEIDNVDNKTKILDNINIDIKYNSILKVLLESYYIVDYPKLIIEYAYRK